MSPEARTKLIVRAKIAFAGIAIAAFGVEIFGAYVALIFSKAGSLSALFLGASAIRGQGFFLPAVALVLVLGATLHIVLTRLDRTKGYNYAIGGALLALIPSLLWAQFGSSVKQQSFGPTVDLGIVALGGIAVGAFIAFVLWQYSHEIVVYQKLPVEIRAKRMSIALVSVAALVMVSFGAAMFNVG